MFFIGLLTRFGFSVEWEKVCGLSMRITFLGLVLDSEHGRIELPEKKLLQLVELAREIKAGDRVSKRQLQDLVGHMSFAAKPFMERVPSREFLLMS